MEATTATGVVAVVVAGGATTAAITAQPTHVPGMSEQCVGADIGVESCDWWCEPAGVPCPSIAGIPIFAHSADCSQDADIATVTCAP